ncbi:hypothetical protein V8D89_004234 [Ganoderma adspersum]
MRRNCTTHNRWTICPTFPAYYKCPQPQPNGWTRPILGISASQIIRGNRNAFNITSLPANKTALKGTPINLQARKPGLPQPKSQTALKLGSVQPAVITAGHRHSQAENATPSICKLTPEKAAELAALKNPFGALSSGRNGQPRGSSTTTPQGRHPTKPSVVSSSAKVSAMDNVEQTSQPANTTASGSGKCNILSANNSHEFDSEAEDAETMTGHGAEHMSHYEVSKLAALAVEGDYSIEDEEQGIPRENDGGAPSIAPSAGDIFEQDDGSDSGLQDNHSHHGYDQLDGINTLFEDEHEGEYNDAPEVQEEDYDSDVPLAKRRHARDEAVLDLRAGYRKAMCVREWEEGKRPCVADYKPDARHILLQAIPIFKALWEAADKLDIELAPNYYRLLLAPAQRDQDGSTQTCQNGILLSGQWPDRDPASKLYLVCKVTAPDNEASTMAITFLPQTQYDLHGLRASIRSGTFICINGVRSHDSVHGISCKPHTNAQNLAIMICALFIYSDFDWHEKALLVIWEARLIIQLPIGVVFLYPSALFIHFNLNISDFTNHIVTTTNGPWPMLGKLSTTTRGAR